MNRLRNILPVLALLLVGTAILAAPSQAKAGFAVKVYDDGVLQGGISSSSTPTTLTFTGTTTNFSVLGSGLSNFPGTASSANLDLSGTNTVVPLFSSTGGTHTIRIEISEDSWTAPTTDPLILKASAGGSVGNGGGTITISATHQAFVDNTNTLFGQPASGASPIQTASASSSAVGTTPLVYSPDIAANYNVPGGTPFSFTEVFEYTFTLSAGSGGDTGGGSGSARVSPTPAPAGLILVFTGMPLLGLGAWVERRRKSR